MSNGLTHIGVRRALSSVYVRQYCVDRKLGRNVSKPPHPDKANMAIRAALTDAVRLQPIPTTLLTLFSHKMVMNHKTSDPLQTDLPGLLAGIAPLRFTVLFPDKSQSEDSSLILPES